jgi:ferredoxin
MAGTAKRDRGWTWRELRWWLHGRTGRRADRSFRLRVLVQSAFALTCVLLGVQFARFVQAARMGLLPLPSRPPGVEGFLPIGGLLGAVDWFHRGALNRIHPAATVILLLVLATALACRKSFCSWICPVGFLSELLARLGRRLFGRNFRLWRWLDVPLRSLKYLLLAFFGWHILTLTGAAARAFVESPYYRLADVKMGLFFTQLTMVGATVLVLLGAASVLWRGFWCRYLCPYGALLGLVSWMSPARIRREPASCIDCGLCDAACGAALPVSRKLTIRSPECVGCLDCVAACPVQEALGMTVARRRVSVPTYAASLLALFLAGYLGARALGWWDNAIGEAEYVEHIRYGAIELYAHPGLDGAGPDGGPAAPPATLAPLPAGHPPIAAGGGPAGSR